MTIDMGQIRCSGYDEFDDGKCQNCVRFNQQCLFDGVSSQAAFIRPPAEHIPSAATQEFPSAVSHQDPWQSISCRLKRIMIDFKQLLDSGPLARFAQEVPLELWAEQKTRLQRWASNIGAYAQDNSSLEFRLREAPSILQHVGSLMRSIQTGVVEVDGYVRPSAMARRSPDTQSNSDSDSTTMLQELYTSIDSYITDLLKVSIIIRNSINHERVMQLDSDAVAQTAPWFIQHVREKFPNCDASVCERLGRAIARRRAEVDYRRKQSEKRKRGLARFLGEQDHEEEKSQTPTKFTDYAKFVQPQDTDSRTETTSQTGYSDLGTAQAEGGLTFPPPPRESANGNPFDCPYCFNPITIQQYKDWPRHVLRDALPYICMVRDCSTGSKLYSSRREYFKHMSRVHSSAPEDIHGQSCLLCHQLPSEKLSVHLSHHLIQLALFSLLPYDAEVDEDKEVITSAQVVDLEESSESEGAGGLALSEGTGLEKMEPGIDLHETDLVSPLERLQALASIYTAQLLPKCTKFIRRPPTDPAVRRMQHLKLSESIMAQIVLKADEVDVEGKNDARTFRKSMVLEASQMMKTLDTVMKDAANSRLQAIQKLDDELATESAIQTDTDPSDILGDRSSRILSKYDWTLGGSWAFEEEMTLEQRDSSSGGQNGDVKSGVDPAADAPDRIYA